MRPAGSLAAAVGLSASTLCSSRLAFSTANDSYAMVSRHKPGASGEVHMRASGGTTVGAWFHVPELAVRDIFFVVPLDYSAPNGSCITIFVREVVGAGKEDHHLPYLLYLQGGPGFECARPADANGWMKKACEEYRVILLDQRGTGLSTPLTPSTLSQFTSAEQQASYLQHFRADNIVRDAEYVRSHLLPAGERWSILGQSFGGFCAVTYLSMAPGGLRYVLLTGGLPPLGKGCTADTVYRECFKRVALQNDKFYSRFPQDEVPVAAAVYYEDMYVSFKLSDASAEEIKGIRTWVTNEYMHSGIREDGPRILDHLFALLKGKLLLR